MMQSTAMVDHFGYFTPVLKTLSNNDDSELFLHKTMMLYLVKLPAVK